MGTVLAGLLIVALVGAVFYIYRRATAIAAGADDDGRDLDRFLVANRELRLERIDNELWATAMQLAHGDDGVARARYVELRVRQMKEQEARAADGQPG